MVDKMTKKELEKPDEFHSTGLRALQYITDHKGKFYLYGAVLVIIIALSGLWHLYLLNYENKAQYLYSTAYDSLASNENTEEVKKNGDIEAAEVYEDLVKQYPRSNAATISFYNMGNIYLKAGEIEKAINVYGIFIKRSDDNSLKALAYQGLGYCYEETEDHENAIKSFEASNRLLKGTVFEYMNYANMGRIYEKMGNQKEAMDLYGKAVGKTNDPITEIVIKKKMATLVK